MTVIGTAPALALALASSVFHGPLTSGRPDDPCAGAHDTLTRTLHEISPTGTRAVRNRIGDASILFRMGRRQEATASLDAALAWLDVTRKRLTPAAERQSVQTAAEGLRQCIATSTPPAQATLTIRTYAEDDRMADGKGSPAKPGALVRIDGMPIGRTRTGGTFTGRVPSGSLHVTVEIPPSEAGAEDISLSPGAAGAASIVLQSSKEVTEETPLVVAEADGGLLSAAARTLTLKFVGVRGAVRIRKIDEIDLLGEEGNSEADLTRMFHVDGGVLAATDPARVIGMLRARGTRLLVLSVEASDETTIHASRVEFRIQ